MAFLEGLPSQGNFTQWAGVLNVPAKTYLCEHNTTPPESGRITTDQTNILIRALTLKQAKDASSKEKRPAEASDAAPAAKRHNSGRGRGGAEASGSKGGASGSGSTSHTERTLLAKTVEQLKILLREKGLGRSGKKEELVARLLQAQEKETTKSKRPAK
eukprot:jgi/Chlat1/6433/Chrsp45S06047